MHTVKSTAANVNEVVEANLLQHGDETDAVGDAGYHGTHKRDNARSDVRWRVAMRPGKRARLDKGNPLGAMINEVERIKASIRPKVEHPFLVIKRQFGFVKVRCCGLKKTTAQLTTLFVLSNLRMVRGKLSKAQV